MNKIIGIVFALFVFALSVGFVSAAPMTTVYGEVMDAEQDPVVGAEVHVVCTHLDVDTTKQVETNEEGMYYAFFGSTECDIGDTVVAKTAGSEDVSGEVTDEYCKVGTMKLDLQIPEFGLIAGAVALVGALGIVLYRRD